MSLSALATLYALVGVGAAMTRLWSRIQPRSRRGDALLLLCLWPLFGPFCLVRLQGGTGQRETEREVALLLALQRARDTPLGPLLPDAETAKELCIKLRLRARKIDEIDAISSRPEFDEQDALARLAALRARGASESATATAALRVQNIRRLGALRDRFAGQLDEIGELILQLSTQAEVTRLAGAMDSSGAHLVAELLARFDELDSAFYDTPDDPLA
jgi:hypothetical protein